jgi:hypothetical protein
MTLMLAMTVIGYGSLVPSRAATRLTAQRGPLPPINIIETDFALGDWAVSVEATAGAIYTVTQELSGGFGDSPFRFMSHSLPSVTGNDLATIAVTHVFLGESYDPAIQGPITAIDYQEAGIILSFPFPEAFSTTQPVIEQDGRIFRSPEFIRFIAENSSHNWEFKSLDLLSSADFIAVDGSGDSPDFSAGGSPLQFGFTRVNTRGSTQPPVPGGVDMVIDQGVDNWWITIHRDSLPPLAVSDVFILDGYQRSLPLLELFHVTGNDEGASLEVIEVTEPLHGTAQILSSSTVVYELAEAQTFDTFDYTISNGALTSSAAVDVYIDCACTVLCLNQLGPLASGPASLQAGEDLDLPLIYQVRDHILKPTLDGRRYIEMYYSSNPEILVNILLNETLRNEAIATVVLWQDNLRSLVDGDGSAIISQAQVDAVKGFLSNLSAVSSPGLQALIADELVRLGPLDDYVGLTVFEAKRQAIGDPTLYMPLQIR